MKDKPKIHFSAQKGWINDPNGPIFFNDEYHIFFQYNPYATHWDNIHWGHARSKDLMHWEELPIALFPDDQGMIFSGCAIFDKDNLSGLGNENDPPVLLFYTSHDEETLREMQCLAYTLDMETFFKYDKNPIIPGKDHTPARDPFIFENKILGGFSLCITREKRIEFYHSNNFLDWEITGSFELPEFAPEGMIECPFMFEDNRHVLVMSMDIADTEFDKLPAEADKHNRFMQYFIGDFDGYKFVLDDGQKNALLIDYGPDLYAGTIFSGVKDTILIAWLGDFSNGAKDLHTEKEGYKGILSLPRKLKLKKTDTFFVLIQSFYPDLKSIDNVIYIKTPLMNTEGSKEDDIYDRSIMEMIDKGFDEILIDGCVRECLKDEGSISYTSYINFKEKND